MSPPCYLKMASLGLWALPFYSLARISPTFCSVASLPIKSMPLVLLGWHLNGVGPLTPPATTTTTNSETAGASCWSPRTWHMDGNLGLRAEDTAPRSNAPRDSGRQERVRPRQAARLVGPALCRLLCSPAKELTQASPTRLVRSALRQHVENLPASRSASNSIAPRAASASLGTASAPFSCFRPAWIWCFRPAWNYAPGHAYWNQDPE